MALILRAIRLDSRNLNRTSSDVIRSEPVTVGPGRVRVEIPVFIWLRHDCEGNLLQMVADMATVVEYGFAIWKHFVAEGTNSMREIVLEKITRAVR